MAGQKVVLVAISGGIFRLLIYSLWRSKVIKKPWNKQTPSAVVVILWLGGALAVLLGGVYLLATIALSAAGL